ncbi:MAG: sodium:calcium antiporter [Spirochaetes bacterium]|nr:sodium:calcium antiporter [Spirochaetota bacterium]
MLGPLENLLTINIFTAIMGLISGILLLWFSSEMVIKKITPIAKFFGVKELVITILGVSILSSLPELTVSVFAAAQGKADISLGNIIGSNFVTLTFVTAICAIIAPIMIRTEIKERESSWMTLSTASIFVLAIDGKLTRIDGIILMSLYLPYIITVIKEAVKESKETKVKTERDKNILLHIIIGILAVFGIIIGANITLTSGQFIGENAGLSNLVLGILIFAFGTSLPELSVALAATFKKKADITIGEIYASNIFTALFVLGFCCIITPMTLFEDPLIPSNLVKYDIPFLILAGIIIQIFVTTGSKLVRLEALIIILLYIYFVLSHFFNLPLCF